MGYVPKYTTKDGKRFKDHKDYARHSNYLESLKQIFEKLVDDDFFKNYKFTSAYFKLKSLGKPTKADWSYAYRGYFIGRTKYILSIQHDSNVVDLVLLSRATTLREKIATLDLFEVFL